ncbi:MAG: HD-GYP domain-containing protein [Armatimonadota bacterium]|nr:HD-GYP domain-containing protein [Armatimonadota bacterium]MDR5696149.1 HD-GYP domain-containing protein [Armatimonadota bacterium]
MRPQLKLLIAVVTAGFGMLAVHVVLLLVSDRVPVLHQDVAVLMSATFAAILTELRPTRFNIGKEGTEVTLTIIIALPVLILYGWPVAFLLLVFAATTTHIQAGKPWFKTVYNVATYGVSVFLAGTAYQSVAGNTAFQNALPHSIIAALLAGGVFFVANSSMIAMVISVAQGLSLPPVLFQNMSVVAPVFGAMIGLAVIAVLLWNLHPAALLLLIPPMIATKLSYENYVRLRTETDSFIQALADAIDLRDPYTSQHSQRVAELATALGRRLGISSQDLHNLEVIARVHDVGKVAVRDAVLQKRGKLDADELGEMQEHVEAGVRILERISLYRPALDVLHQHHERLDGSGYPQGLKGEEILYPARILAVADAYDAMTTDRPYRPAKTPEATVRELYSVAGKEYDLSVVRALEDELIARGVLKGPIIPAAIEPPAEETVAPAPSHSARVIPIHRAGQRTSSPSS